MGGSSSQISRESKPLCCCRPRPVYEERGQHSPDREFVDRVDLTQPPATLYLSYINLASSTDRPTTLPPSSSEAEARCHANNRDLNGSLPGRTTDRRRREGEGEAGLTPSLEPNQLGFGGQDQVVFGRNKSRARKGRNGIEGRRSRCVKSRIEVSTLPRRPSCPCILNWPGLTVQDEFLIHTH